MYKERFQLLTEEQKEAHRAIRRERQRAWAAAKKLGHTPAADGKKRKIAGEIIQQVAPQLATPKPLKLTLSPEQAAKKEAMRIEVKERIAKRKAAMKEEDKKKRHEEFTRQRREKRHAKKAEQEEFAIEILREKMPLYKLAPHEFLVQLLKYRLYLANGGYDDIRAEFPEAVSAEVTDTHYSHFKELFPVKKRSVREVIVDKEYLLAARQEALLHIAVSVKRNSKLPR